MEKEKDFDNIHWADSSAMRTIEMFPNEKIYVVASGITPSGTVHIGNFREIITSELVRRALENKGKKTRFIYSWDSYDAFRKVPANVPKEWERYLRLPDGMVPDPWECHETYGEHFMQEAEESLKVFNFPIEFQRQHILQTSGIYAEGIKKHLNAREKVRMILDKFRSEPLDKSWFPLDVFSERTGKDKTEIVAYDEEYEIQYKDEGSEEIHTINFKETPIVKLPWRLDWPMRWAHYGVNFEPGGKDHSTPGGSYDTACQIIKEVSGRDAPVYTFYNFVSMKGQGGKISSSKGNAVTVGDVLDIYTPELVIYLFAGTRPSAEFAISFDMDVIKVYEDFDKLERIYYGKEEEKNEKVLAYNKRIYELCQHENKKPQTEMPAQFAFRHLTTVIQANDFDMKKVEEFFKDEIKTDFDRERLQKRAKCAMNWIEMYAPEDMKFKLAPQIHYDKKAFEGKAEKLMKDLHGLLANSKTADDFNGKLKVFMEENVLDPKEFYLFMYKALIGKEKGPRLAAFMFDNKKKILKLI